MNRDPSTLSDYVKTLLQLNSSSSSWRTTTTTTTTSMTTTSTTTIPYVHPDLVVSSTEVVHGRGLMINGQKEQENNDDYNNNVISPGDILFITPPTIEAPIESVLRVYEKNQHQHTLETIAETILLKEMKRNIRKKTSKATSIQILQDQHTTTKNEQSPKHQLSNNDDIMLSILSGTPVSDPEHNIQQILIDDNVDYDDDDTVRGIIRQNAFGPDFHHYERIQEEILKHGYSTKNIDDCPYQRILGMYPLAAMINHSCQTNATRTFVGNIMIATATQPILPGQEIVWSYIPPTTDYTSRQIKLQSYGFTCTCPRCREDDDEQQWTQIQYILSSTLLSSSSSKDEWDMMLQQVETIYEQNKRHSHSLRLSLTNMYIQYFNQALTSVVGSIHNDTENNDLMYSTILKYATQLHWSFCLLHNGSTEHISIVHLCYDLSRRISTANASSSQFWMEQLKKVHACRYSKYSIDDVNNLRKLLQHTKLVLRTLDGWHQSKCPFI